MLALALAACGPFGGEPSAGPDTGGGTATIAIKNFTFPALTVRPGTTVTVVNHDSALHTVTAADHSFDTGAIPPHGQASFTAPAMPGSYPYHCTIHPYMNAVLVVRFRAATS